MRDELIAFIRATQRAMKESNFRQEFELGSLRGTSAENEVPLLRFGYGYFQPDQVLYFPPAKVGKLGSEKERPLPAQMSVEEAVDKFLAFFGAPRR